MDVVRHTEKSKELRKSSTQSLKTKLYLLALKASSDFTIHKDEERKEEYIKRHSKMANTGVKSGVKTPGFLVVGCFGISQQSKNP
jgi:hypothetical protein